MANSKRITKKATKKSNTDNFLASLILNELFSSGDDLLTRSQKLRLSDLSEATNVNMVRYVRRAVDNFLNDEAWIYMQNA